MTFFGPNNVRWHVMLCTKVLVKLTPDGSKLKETTIEHRENKCHSTSTKFALKFHFICLGCNFDAFVPPTNMYQKMRLKFEQNAANVGEIDSKKHWLKRDVDSGCLVTYKPI